MTEQLEATILEVAGRCLRHGSALEPTTSFELLGLDSLAVIELAAALESELGCELPPDILAECTDARSLAQRLTSEGIQARLVDPFEQMQADAVLPDDVRPAVKKRNRTTDLRTARTILLTGATGFLGQALLRELTDSTDARILCLVRPSSAGRIAPSARVTVVEGDLEHVRFGLNQEKFDRLAADIDAVCHCGASVNWVYSYPSLRGANVLGTLELLRLACRTNASFHFISSISACYSTGGPRSADESFDALPHLRGVQLGYAQTKVVAEALVRAAGQRGLPVRIYRPALLAGHSVSGDYNRDDLISALVRGCVAMRTAPDLDWKLDCEPVDSAAAAIVRLSGAPGSTFHLVHPRARHWRECVLWMRMYGYDVRLVSYPAWLRQLVRETRAGSESGREHPLRPLRSFFLDRPGGGGGLTLPELYEESRRTQAVSSRTRAILKVRQHETPPLDAKLLHVYFGAFRRGGDLPDPTPAHRPGGRPASTVDAALVSRAIGAPVEQFDVLSAGSDHSIVSELTAWRSGRNTGLFRARLTTAQHTGSRDVVLKIKAADADVIAVGEALAEMVDATVGREYRRFGDRIGFAQSHSREIEVYRQQDRRFTNHAPSLVGSIADDAEQTWMAVLEYVNDAVVADSSAERPWDPHDIERAIDGAAALHSIWMDRSDELNGRPWIGHVQSTASMVEMSPLWTALAAHASPSFSSWSDRTIATIHQHLVAAVGRWWPALEHGPRTLIHNDFNPRNICLRGADRRLCAYDWELATIGAPQRDLAELLCFTLPMDTPREQVVALIDRHRATLEREAGRPIDAALWDEGFRAGLYDLLITRLSIYAMVDRVRRQSFLPRVLRTWRVLYQMFPLETAA